VGRKRGRMDKNIKLNDDGTVSPIDPAKPSRYTTEPTIDELVEMCFDDLCINNTGNYIRITFGDKSMNVDYEHFLAFRKRIEALISDQVAKARIDSIKDYADALIDLFVNPPVEVGAAEDIHLHPWQIKNMILESLNHLDELNGVKNK